MGLFEESKVTLKDGTEVILRNASESDSESLNKAFFEILTTSPYVLSTPESAKNKTAEDAKKWIQEANQNPREGLIIAEAKGRIIGITDFRSFKDKKRSHRAAFGMSVHHDFRGQGLGLALLQRLIAVTKEIEGLTLLELNVMSPNIAAIELYRKLNFKETGRYPNAYQLKNGDFVDDISMYLAL